jgi:DNA-binding transcriptional LysR family regulator
VPQRVLEFSSVEAVKRCAALGLGIAGLPDLTVAAEIADGRLVDLESPLPIPAIPTAIVSPREPGAAVRAFIEAASLSRRES